MKILRKKWFWIGLVTFLVSVILFELIFLNVWAVNNIVNGDWDQRLLFAAIGLLISDSIGSLSKWWKVNTKQLSLLAFIAMLFGALVIHGFFKALLLSATVLILSKLLRGTIFILRHAIRRLMRRPEVLQRID